MDEQLHILTGSYALNALEGDERTSFEQHALAAEQTREEVRGLSAAAAMLAYGVEPVRPPQRVKDNVMAAIRNTRQLPAEAVATDGAADRAERGYDGGVRPGAGADLRLGPGEGSGPERGGAQPAAGAGSGTDELAGRRGRRSAGSGGSGGSRSGGTRPGGPRRGTVRALAAAAALLLLAGAGLAGWALGQSAENSRLEQQLAQAQQTQGAMLGILTSEDAKVATARMADGAVVTVAYAPSLNQGAVTAHGLPELPAGKTYELWLQHDDVMVPAGLMSGASAGSPMMTLLEGQLSGATAVGITVEPEGGSPAPTTEPIMVREL
ncbi:anti-sigma factor domain-containing protein [Arthrobacter sp. USHLN218]|uniref:anti-sigma factor n=1 Tax=Arthrobacter sp. USHLN218 TaxID=3081232 RepID=UPI0030189733